MLIKADETLNCWHCEYVGCNEIKGIRKKCNFL